MSARNTTGRARLPAIPPVSVQDNSMKMWMQAVAERLEVREGARGDEGERVVTQRDLDSMLAAQKPTVSEDPWWAKYSDIGAMAEDLRGTSFHDDMVLRIKNSTGEPLVGATGSETQVVTQTSTPPKPPDALRLVRNDLDFYRLPTETSQIPSTYQEFVCTVNTADFFSQGGDHIAFALDCLGEAGSGNPHNAPVIRNGKNLFSLARGFIIFGSGAVFAEQWNGTFSPAVDPVASTISGFSPSTTPIFTVRIVAGYRTGALANHMAITIHRGGGNGQVLFAGSKPWGWDWSGRHVAYFAAIAAGFKSPNETGNVERIGSGIAPNATVHFSGASLTTV